MPRGVLKPGLSWKLPIAAALAAAGPAFGAELTVTVAGIRNADGLVEICLFNRPDAFPDCGKDSSVLRRRIPAVPGQVRARFEGLAPGTYAVSVFHDEKRIGKVETNFLGIPRSGVGASNDPQARFGPPSFASAAFTLPDRAGAITVQMRYP